MNKNYDVLIVGGGIVGLTAALAMQKKGCSVALLDSGLLNMDFSLDNSRVYAINEASQTLFQELDVWQLMDQKRFSPYKNMHVWDAQSGASIHFDARLMAAAQLGFILEEAMIRAALLEKIASLNDIHLFSESPVDKVLELDDTIQAYSKNKVWTGKLLMVTDGAQSSTRALLQVPLTSWPYHQHALVATVHTELPHQQTAWQVFHPQGPLAFLPLANPNQCSIVWTTTPEEASRLMECTEQDFNHAITQAFALRLGAVTLASSRHHFPLTMRHAQHYTGKHWMLLGDAAHTIHPLAGLGLNLGLADIATWISCLPSYPTLPVSSRMLSSYQRTRKYETWLVIALMEGLKKLFGNKITPMVFLRSLGLRTCDTLTPLKRFLVHHAMGKSK